MTFIILAGEMKDVDYADCFGPFDTAAEAETAAQELVSRGVIVIEPDDCMDYRVMPVRNPADVKSPEAPIDVEPTPHPFPSAAEQFKNNPRYDSDGAYIPDDQDVAAVEALRHLFDDAPMGNFMAGFLDMVNESVSSPPTADPRDSLSDSRLFIHSDDTGLRVITPLGVFLEVNRDANDEAFEPYAFTRRAIDETTEEVTIGGLAAHSFIKRAPLPMNWHNLYFANDTSFSTPCGFVNINGPFTDTTPVSSDLDSLFDWCAADFGALALATDAFALNAGRTLKVEHTILGPIQTTLRFTIE
jgi:hypothetical protein